MQHMSFCSIFKKKKINATPCGSIQVERPSLLIENLKKQKQSQTFHNADSEMEDLSQQGKEFL